MSWMVDEYSKLVGHWTPGTFTGKPLSIGGSLGRDTATAQGGLYVLEAYLTSFAKEVPTKEAEDFVPEKSPLPPFTKEVTENPLS